MQSCLCAVSERDPCASLESGYVTPRVVLQAGTGLIMRSDGDLAIRYQDREYRLGPAETRHYRATLDQRVEAYDITLMPDEIVMSNFNGAVVLSHPFERSDG